MPLAAAVVIEEGVEVSPSGGNFTVLYGRNLSDADVVYIEPNEVIWENGSGVNSLNTSLSIVAAAGTVNVTLYNHTWDQLSDPLLSSRSLNITATNTSASTDSNWTVGVFLSSNGIVRVYHDGVENTTLGSPFTPNSTGYLSFTWVFNGTTRNFEFVETARAGAVDCTDIGVPNSFIRVIEFNATDEESYVAGGSINATIGFALTLTDPGGSVETSILNIGNSSVSVCIPVAWVGDTLGADITFHNGAEFPLSGWYIRDTSISDQEHNVTAALVNSSLSTLSQIYVIDCEGVQAEDYFITILQYNYDNSSWTPLRMSQTDPNGLGGFNLIRNDKFYSFFVHDDDMVFQQTFSNYLITTLETTLQVDVCAIPYLPLALTGVSHSCSNTSTTIDCTVEDHNDPLRVTEWVLRVWTGRAVNFTLDCMRTSTSNPASLSCPITPGEVYFFNLKARMNPDVILTAGTVGNFSQTGGYGAHGLLIAAIFTVALGFVGAYNASLFVLFIFVGNALSWAIGLSQPTGQMTISLFATLTAIVIWRVKPR